MVPPLINPTLIIDPEIRRPGMGERFWNGIGIIACIAAGVFAVTWMSLH